MVVEYVVVWCGDVCHVAWVGRGAWLCWRNEWQWLGTLSVKSFFRRCLVTGFSLVDTFLNNLFHRVTSTRCWELWRSCSW